MIELSLLILHYLKNDFTETKFQKTNFLNSIKMRFCKSNFEIENTETKFQKRKNLKFQNPKTKIVKIGKQDFYYMYKNHTP